MTLLRSAALGLALLAAAPAFAQTPPPRAAVAPTAETWAAAWGAAPVAAVAVARPGEVRAFADLTARQLVRLNAGGDAVRLRLTNELGERPLRVGAVSLAVAGPDGRPLAAPIPVTFGGQAEVEIPPGAPLLSDPVVLATRPMDQLSIAVFYVEAAPAAHRLRLFLSPQGNHTREAAVAGEQAVLKGPAVVSGVEVRGAATKVVVAIGDSITEGAGSTPNADAGWPEQLAARVAGRNGGWSVVNMGVGGGRLLRDIAGPSALARFDRDVLSVPGVAAVVVLEGINDIGRSAQPGYAGEAVTVEELIAGDRQLIARAHARGVKVYGATLPPFEGAAYFHAAGEAKRQALNAWIRAGGAFDGVIDFEAVVRDPAQPSQILPAFHNGDHLHPNDAGYAAMAAAADRVVFGK